MQTLRPNKSSAPVLLEGDISLQGALWILEFRIQTLSPVIGLRPDSANWTLAEISRQDHLWNTTCFEAFLKPVGESLYYEFNFSLLPAWNVFEFTSYRQPQPPAPSQAFDLRQMTWDQARQKLEIQLMNQTSFTDFEVGLTAVIEDTERNKHYYALKHAGEKSDFHWDQSFILRRGSKI